MFPATVKNKNSQVNHPLEYNFEATSPETKLSTLNTTNANIMTNRIITNNYFYGNTPKNIHPLITSDGVNNAGYDKSIYNGYYSSTNKYAITKANTLPAKCLQTDNLNNSKIYEQKQNRSFIY